MEEEYTVTILEAVSYTHLFSDKFDITKHKRYKELSDYDKKNAFDMEQYVKHLHHLKAVSYTHLRYL